jgi:hypothetical protein
MFEALSRPSGVSDILICIGNPLIDETKFGCLAEMNVFEVPAILSAVGDAQ